MSSFLHSARHFKSVSKSLHHLMSNVPDHEILNVPYELRYIFNDNFSYDNILITLNDIFRALIKISDEAVGNQYNEFDPVLTHLTLHDYDDCNDFIVLNHVNTFKALQSIKYQIGINYITDVRKLTTDEENALKFLNVIINELAIKIVTMSLDYKSSEYWEIN